MEFEPMLTPRENPLYRKMSPEEDRTRDAVDSEPKHYQLSYSGPPHSVSTQWLSETESSNCNFYVIVAACTFVWADPSLRYTSMLLGC